MTDRQKHILKTIIEHFIENQGMVSSFDILEEMALPVSSATIRNDMATLVNNGYLAKAYFSSGRLPTHKGIRFYVNNLMSEDVLTFNDLVHLSQQMFEVRFDTHQLLREAMKTLSHLSGESSLVFYNNVVQFYGLAKLLERQETLGTPLRENYKKGLARFLKIIEDSETLTNMFAGHHDYPRRNICMFVGSDDATHPGIENFTLVFSPFQLSTDDRHNPGYLATIGYANMDYRKVVPSLEYVSDIVNAAPRSW